MSDIRLHQIEGGLFDVRVVDNDLETDDGLESSIIISLFCDRRVTAEELPPEETSYRGFWADVAIDEKDLTGSKLWLLAREKVTPDVLARAKEYCEEALKWLLDDGVAESVTVTVERGGLYQIGIAIEVKRPGDKASQKYAYIWSSNTSIRMAA